MKRPSYTLGSGLHPLRLGLAAAGLAGLTLLANLALVAPQRGEFVSAALAVLPALGALALAQTVLGYLRGPWPIRAITLGVQVAGWYWLATQAGARLAGLRSLPLLPDEAFGALIWSVPLTPLLWAAGALGYPALVRWLERRAPAENAREKGQRI